MKCQSLFSGKNKKNISKMSFAETFTPHAKCSAFGQTGLSNRVHIAECAIQSGYTLFASYPCRGFPTND